MGTGSQRLLPNEGVFDTDMGDSDVDKQEPGGVEVEGPDTDIRGGARTDEVTDINFGGPGFSCCVPEVIRGGSDP